jgi:hypothetical protein
MTVFRELGFSVLFALAICAALVTVGTAAERMDPDRNFTPVYEAAHAVAVSEGVFVLQATGFCEPSVDRFVTVDLVTGHSRFSGC